jgi:hypothetical protein
MSKKTAIVMVTVMRTLSPLYTIYIYIYKRHIHVLFKDFQDGYVKDLYPVITPELR